MMMVSAAVISVRGACACASGTAAFPSVGVPSPAVGGTIRYLLAEPSVPQSVSRGYRRRTSPLRCCRMSYPVRWVTVGFTDPVRRNDLHEDRSVHRTTAKAPADGVPPFVHGESTSDRRFWLHDALTPRRQPCQARAGGRGRSRRSAGDGRGEGPPPPGPRVIRSAGGSFQQKVGPRAAPPVVNHRR